MSPAHLAGTTRPLRRRAAGEPADRLDLVRRHFDLIDAGDPEAMAELFESDAVYLRPGYEPFLGRAEILRFYREVRTIREGRHTLDTVIGADGQVAVRGSFTGRQNDGNPVDLRFSDFFDLGDTGRFHRRETFFAAPLI
ncbi:nuclear transport factor 2 family protein [Micromonospora siamensis]|uniref:Ketosteroid isomerase-related protein n=1 Tax=Micromonospora siamensis TaxID=299152 RepID=A0A1C5J801_9ACTN|nr:nuclear transport factor 2 family protein [Micromonospora siamensis]SCG66734.1 Ketosteroid isomerase-related protein [Micromonospora siamensis]